MEHPLYQRELMDGVRIVGVQTSRFKTLRVSVSFAVPLRAETAGVNALAISLLQRSCARYPDFTALNKRLAELYGAIVYARINKQGDAQVLTLYISTVDDRFALEGEPLTDACADLLCDMLFDPVTENGLLTAQAVELEKRLLKEKIDSELSDKRQYALEQCEAAMCADEPFGLSKYGRVEDIAADDRKVQTDMVTLNCRSLTRMTLLCLPYFTAGSRIINLASAAAFCPQPGFAVYAATKSYVLSFSRSLGAELKDKRIYVTAVCPGPVDTEFFQVSGALSSPLKKLTMAPAPRVVHQALKDSRTGKAMSVYGIPMKAVRILTKILPCSVILKAEELFTK